jgi:hypothetical protein
LVKSSRRRNTRCCGKRRWKAQRPSKSCSILKFEVLIRTETLSILISTALHAVLQWLCQGMPDAAIEKMDQNCEQKASVNGRKPTLVG